MVIRKTADIEKASKSSKFDASTITKDINGKELKPLPRARSDRKYDWDKAREFYIHGEELDDGTVINFTLSELSRKTNIPYQVLRVRSIRESWKARREVYLVERTRAMSQKRIAEISKKSKDFDAKAFKTAEKGLDLVNRRLNEIWEEASRKSAALQEAQERLARGEVVARWELLSPIYHRELEGLATAAERFQTIGMRALGTDVKKLDITGGEGMIQQNNTLNIHQEMTRDDPNRMAALVRGLIETGLIERFSPEAIESGIVIDAEEVQDVPD